MLLTLLLRDIVDARLKVSVLCSGTCRSDDRLNPADHPLPTRSTINMQYMKISG